MPDGFDNNPLVTEAALAAEHRALFGWAMSRCGNDRATAEDLMQECYLMLLDGRARWDGRSALRTFLFGVVQNLARNRGRSTARRDRLGLRLAAEPDAEAHDAAPERSPDPALHNAIRRLPARQRDVLELHSYRDFSLQETAQVLGISTGSARTHWHRAKQALRSALADNAAGREATAP